MKIGVYYHSTTGNTKRVAMEIARGLDVEAVSIGGSAPRENLDLLFLGGAVYATSDHGLHPDMRRFISSLDASRVKRVALFRTGFSDDALKAMAGLLERKGIPLTGESYGCKGRFLVFNMGHPGARNIEEARAFARRVAGKTSTQL